MTFPSSSFNVSSNSPITSSHKDGIVLANATAGGFNLTLDDPVTFGFGVVVFKKTDITSNLVKLLPAAGTFEEGRTSLPLSLESDSCMMFSDGSGWYLIGTGGISSLRHNPIVAEHTITISSYNIDPTYNGYIMLCDCATAGTNIMIDLPPISAAAYNHQTFTVFVEKFDTSANIVSVVSQAGDVIHDPRAVFLNPSWKVDITKPMQCLSFWTDGARWIVASSNGV